MLCGKLFQDFELFHKAGSVEINIDRWLWLINMMVFYTAINAHKPFLFSEGYLLRCDKKV